MECYGTIDELNSWIGVIISQLNSEEASLSKDLERIQNELFDLGTDLATPEESSKRNQFPKKAAEWLEAKIDDYSTDLPELHQFILPGGTLSASSLHVARTIVRRSERLIVKLGQKEAVNPEILKYINRLSDYLFVAARWINVRNSKNETNYQSIENR